MNNAARPLLLRYIAGWTAQNVAAVVATLADACTIIESYGPIYRGRHRVAQWMDAWFAAGGSIQEWRVNHFVAANALQVAEWTFSCTWNNAPSTFDGVTVAHLDGDAISYLREYATTAPLYEWRGTWRDQRRD